MESGILLFSRSRCIWQIVEEDCQTVHISERDGRASHTSFSGDSGVRRADIVDCRDENLEWHQSPPHTRLTIRAAVMLWIVFGRNGVVECRKDCIGHDLLVLWMSSDCLPAVARELGDHGMGQPAVANDHQEWHPFLALCWQLTESRPNSLRHVINTLLLLDWSVSINLDAE